MKRLLLSTLGLFLVAALIGLTGCEGGGIEPGMADTKQAPDIPLDKMKSMANIADGTTPPPSVAKKTIPKPAETPAAPAEKDKN